MFSATLEGDAVERLTKVADVARPNLQQAVKMLAVALEEALRVTAPLGRHYTYGGDLIPGGDLRESLRFDVGELGATLLGAQHGEYVITGTPPHPIQASAAPELAFFWAKIGKSFRFGAVNHPGTRPNDFRSKAIDLAFENGQLDLVTSGALNATAAGEATS